MLKTGKNQSIQSTSKYLLEVPRSTKKIPGKNSKYLKVPQSRINSNYPEIPESTKK